MNRAERRRVKKSWDKVPSMSYFETYCYDVNLPNSVANWFFKVDEGLVACVSWDMFCKKRLLLVPVFYGFARFDLGDCFKLGVASDEELDELFGEDDEDFEF